MNQYKHEEDFEDKKHGIVREILEFVIYIGVVIAATYLIIHFVGQRTYVSGSSMESTLSDGDNLIVDKISYRFHDPERFDVIVFPYEHAEKTYFIKRIIGMPGETIRIDDDGNIYINEEELDESYGREVIKNPGIAAEPILLGPDEYFVMGDNRNNSTDSRDSRVGVLNRSDLIGRAFIRIWPLNKFGVIKHR